MTNIWAVGKPVGSLPRLLISPSHIGHWVIASIAWLMSMLICMTDVGICYEELLVPGCRVPSSVSLSLSSTWPHHWNERVGSQVSSQQLGAEVVDKGAFGFRAYNQVPAGVVSMVCVNLENHLEVRKFCVGCFLQKASLCLSEDD